MSQETKVDLELEHALKEAALADAKSLFRAGFFILPALYLGFWLLDLIYSPSHKWPFLGMRIAMAAIAFGLFRLSSRSNSLRTHYWLGITYSFFAANFITVMTVMTDGPTSIYYAGLNLVGLAAIWFIPANKKYLAFAAGGIYGPYFLSALIFPPASISIFLINCAFIVGTLLMALLIRMTHTRTQESEVRAKVQLKREIRDREQIIRQKTDESVLLQKLSSQFSPQVVDAIRRGEIKIGGSVNRAEICAIFIDIVGSTERVVKLDREKFDVVLRRFMEECFGILLKYDLTIDKFLGDGILAFSNEPAKRSDFVQRTLFAAIEIRNRLTAETEFFERHWRKTFQVRMGIAVGYANVGFHGSDRYYKTFTAIGRPLALAARLCAAAEPNEILIDGDAAEIVKSEKFKLDFIGKKQLKGFDDEIIFTYSLLDAPPQNFINTGAMACPSCGGNVMTLEESNGLYFMKCKACGFVLDSPSAAA